MYMFVVNFDALAQASDFLIERRHIVFLCWMQDSNQGLWNLIFNRLNAPWETDWTTEDQATILTQQPALMISEHSAHSTPLLVGFRTSAECRIRSWEVWNTNSPADWMSADKPTELSRIKQKLELNSPPLWAASIEPTRPHFRLAFAPMPNTRFEAGKSETPNRQQTEYPLTNRLSYRGSS